MIRFPEVHVRLSGEDGNAFSILSRVQREMRRAGIPEEVIEQFIDEATSGDYDHLVATCMRWVDVE
jgi:hypothetical protein